MVEKNGESIVFQEEKGLEMRDLPRRRRDGVDCVEVNAIILVE